MVHGTKGTDFKLYRTGMLRLEFELAVTMQQSDVKMYHALQHPRFLGLEFPTLATVASAKPVHHRCGRNVTQDRGDL